MKKIVIKPDAKPIDNIKKFAWDDEDYIEIEVPDPHRPAQQQTVQSQIADISEAIVESI